MKKITYSEYFDKVYGCWLGKSIGGACGALSENNKNILDYTIDNVFPEVIPPNDDLDLQVLWLCEVLEKKGIDVTSSDFAYAFKEHNICLANEYSVAIRNITGGIMPPMSGEYLNDYFKNSMGCPIRSEIWATLAPASINTVKKYVELEGQIDHTDESIYYETLNAVMECVAFFEDDLVTIVKTALKEIPAESRVAKATEFVLEQYLNGVPWDKARNTFIRKFGSHDASFCDANCGITLLSLLYGEKDYTKTLLYSVNGGYDTDCTAGIALSIVGIITGAKNTPKFWLDKIGTELVVGTVDIDCPYKTIESFADATCKAGLSFMENALLDVEITDIPDDVRGSLPKSRARKVDISAEYGGKPVIAKGETKTVTVKIKNLTNEDIKETLKINVADSLSCDKTECEIDLKVNGESYVDLTFKVKDGVSILPLNNHNSVEFAGESFEIGICGAYSMKLIGPFWDNYNSKVFESDPYEGKMPCAIGNICSTRAMFGGFVNIDKQYIDESFNDLDEILSGNTDVPCIDVNFHGDIFEIEDYITFRGCCCVYLVFDFICDDDLKGYCHLGNNAPFKYWENGVLLKENNEHTSWMPYNDEIGVNFKKGKNRLIFKLTRDDKFKFSYSVRSFEDKLRLYSGINSIV